MEKQTAGRNQLGEFAPKFAELNDDVLFGEVWSREDKFSTKNRCMITIAGLIGKGCIDSSFQYHLMNAKKNGVSVEAELGTVGGTEDGVVVDQKDVCYTDPQDAVEFVKQTGIDALAVAIGTNHGQYKSKTNINFERLKEIKEVIDIPLVIHGGTGVKEEDVKKVINLGIRKFNVGTELLVGWNKKAKECYDKNKENISNRENVVPCLNTIDEIVERKINLFKNIK